MKFQLRANDDHTSGRIIDAFAQQVFAEPSLLALDHVGQRLQRSIGRTKNRSLTAVIVEQSVDGLLQHSLFVANDDFRRVQVNQLLQAVVAVNDTTVKVIQVTGREVSGIEQDEGPQVRRDDGNHVLNHPFGAVITVSQSLNNFQSLDQILGRGLTLGRRQLTSQFF